MKLLKIFEFCFFSNISFFAFTKIHITVFFCSETSSYPTDMMRVLVGIFRKFLIHFWQFWKKMRIFPFFEGTKQKVMLICPILVQKVKIYLICHNKLFLLVEHYLLFKALKKLKNYYFLPQLAKMN